MAFKHQGDVALYPFNGPVKGAKIYHKGSFILARGEQTGHHHELSVSSPEMMEIREAAGGFLITLHEQAVLRHQEHGDITLEPGVYRSAIEREYDWSSVQTRQSSD